MFVYMVLANEHRLTVLLLLVLAVVSAGFMFWMQRSRRPSWREPVFGAIGHRPFGYALQASTEWPPRRVGPNASGRFILSDNARGQIVR